MFEIGYKKFMDIIQASSLLNEKINEFSCEGDSLIIRSNKSKIIIPKVVTVPFETFCVDIEAPHRTLALSAKQTGKVSAVMNGEYIHFSHDQARVKTKKEEFSEIKKEEAKIIFTGKLTGNELEDLSKRLSIGESMKVDSTENVFITCENNHLYLLGTDGYIAYRAIINGKSNDDFLAYFRKEDFRPFRLLIKNLPKGVTKKEHMITLTNKQLIISSDDLHLEMPHIIQDDSLIPNIPTYSMSRFFTDVRSWTKIEVNVDEVEMFKEVVKGTTKKNEDEKQEEKMFRLENDKLCILNERELLILNSFGINLNGFDLSKKSLVGAFKHLKEIVTSQDDKMEFYLTNFKKGELVLLRREVDNGSYICSLATR